jgi:hypothetical protein
MLRTWCRRNAGVLAAVVVVAVLVIVPATGAQRVLLTGEQIKDESITSRDVRGLTARDFSRRARARLLKIGRPGPRGPAGPIGERGPEGSPGP